MQDMILFPSETSAHFDKKANSLIAALRPLQVHSQSKPLRGSRAHLPVTHIPEADIIGPIEFSTINGLGCLLGFEIHEANIHEFLPKEASEELEKIADTVGRRRELRVYCSSTYVREHLIGWIRRRRLQKPADNS